MRDQAVIGAFDKMEKMVGHDIRLLNKTVATLAMRQDALQKVLFGGRFSLLWAFFLNVFAPKMLERAVGRMHDILRMKYEQQMKEAIEEARKPKVIQPGEETLRKANIGGLSAAGAILLFLMAGCAPKSHVKRAYDDGFQKANVECLQLQGKFKDYITQLQLDNTIKTERLKMLNQVDEKGALRYGEKTLEKKK